MLIQLDVRLRWLIPISLVSIITAHSTSIDASPQWNYDRYDRVHGPLYWSTITHAYSVCNTGFNQSPINIIIDTKINQFTHHIHTDINTQASPVNDSAVYEDRTLQPIIFNYRESDAHLYHHKNQWSPSDTTDELFNTGKTIELRYEPGSYITIDSSQYELVQLHFHSPSEHSFNGRHYAMELHMVHRSISNKNSMVVVAVMLATPSTKQQCIDNVQCHNIQSISVRDTDTMINELELIDKYQIHYDLQKHTGSRHVSDKHSSDNTHNSDDGGVVDPLDIGENAFLKSIEFSSDHIPHRSGEQYELDSTINIYSILPFDLGYYTYSGSLTTPPCTESVQWYIIKEPISISERQRAAFVDVFGRNARPIQLVNQRRISATSQTPFDDVILLNNNSISTTQFYNVMAMLVIVSVALLISVLYICTRTTSNSNNTSNGAQWSNYLSTQYHSWSSKIMGRRKLGHTNNTYHTHSNNINATYYDGMVDDDMEINRNTATNRRTNNRSSSQTLSQSMVNASHMPHISYSNDDTYTDTNNNNKNQHQRYNHLLNITNVDSMPNLLNRNNNPSPNQTQTLVTGNSTTSYGSV